MRIAFLTLYLDLGEDTDSGIGRHIRLLADALAAREHEVHVIFATPDAQRARSDLTLLSPRWRWDVVETRLPRWLEASLSASHRWTIHLLLLYTLLAWKSARVVARLHRDRPFDVAETHSYNFPGLFLTLFTRPPVLTRVSTTLRQMLPINLVRSRALGRNWDTAVNHSLAAFELTAAAR